MDFVKLNNLHPRKMFEYRKNYDTYIKQYIEWITFNRPDLDHNFIDVWYNKYLYGKVDNNFIPVYPKERYIRVVESENKEDMYLLQFVYDAYSDFKDYFFTSCNKQGIVVGDFIDGEIHRGYESAFESYTEHVQGIVNSYWDVFYFNKKENNVANFTEFAKEFIDYLTNQTVDVFTFSGYVESGYNSIYSTALALDMVDGEYFNDEDKITTYFDSDIYTVFVEAARRFGFLVDRNIPWRIVADLNSKAMQYYIHRMLDLDFIENVRDETGDFENFTEYMVDFIDEYTTLDEYMLDKNRIPLTAIFDIFFEKTYNVSLEGEDDMLRSLVISMYNDLVEVEKRRMTATIDQYTGMIRVSTICRTVKDILSHYNEPNWLKEYTKIRLVESGFSKNDSNFKILLRKTSMMKKILDNEKNLNYISNRLAFYRYKLKN